MALISKYKTSISPLVCTNAFHGGIKTVTFVSMNFKLSKQ